MILRPYQKTDKDACLNVLDSNLPTFFAAYERVDFEGFLSRPTDYFVLEAESIIGCGGYALEKGIAWLCWGMIERKHHGTGLGKWLLLERLYKITQHPDIKMIHLDTTQHAFGFFQKLGFVTEKITVDGYAPNLNRYDMHLTLNPDSGKTFLQHLQNHKQRNNYDSPV
jgi:ribosomal protein S18 acetylase RimI-like enzyme